MTCKHEGEKSDLTKKVKCAHPRKPAELSFCQIICLLRKCPIGVINP